MDAIPQTTPIIAVTESGLTVNGALIATTGVDIDPNYHSSVMSVFARLLMSNPDETATLASFVERSAANGWSADHVPCDAQELLNVVNDANQVLPEDEMVAVKISHVIESMVTVHRYGKDFGESLLYDGHSFDEAAQAVMSITEETQP